MAAADRIRRHCLYRFYDATHSLLYIGITGSLGARVDQHADSKDWFDGVATIHVEHFTSWAAVKEAETVAIREEKPIYNRAHNDSTSWSPHIAD